MTAFEFLAELGTAKLAILGVCLALAAGLLSFALLKVLKEFSLKAGNVVISLKNSEQRKDIINLVFDYGVFQDQMNDTRDLAVDNLHKMAKRLTKSAITQYFQRFRSEYADVLEPTVSDSKQITNVIFNMFTNELKGAMFGYLMDIYENNHLASKSDAEMKAMAHEHYEKLADMFRDHAAAIWIPVMQPYGQVRDIAKEMAPFGESVTYDILCGYKSFSETRGRVFSAAKKICDGVRGLVSKDLRLPQNAMYLAENFYTESGGFDASLISEFLEEM